MVRAACTLWAVLESLVPAPRAEESQHSRAAGRDAAAELDEALAEEAIPAVVSWEVAAAEHLEVGGRQWSKAASHEMHRPPRVGQCR